MPHIYWINMDRSTQRRVLMERMLNRLNISHTRVPALDSKDPAAEQRFIFRDGQGSHCKDEECRVEFRTVQFCAASHVTAMMMFLNTSTEPYALIAEDDLDVEAYTSYWERSFGEYFAEIPADWAIAQVSTIVIPPQNSTWKDYLRGLLVNGWAARHWSSYWLGAGAYIVKRETAELVVKEYVEPNGVIDLNKGQWEAVADVMMFEDHVVYSLPLLSYTMEGSTMHMHDNHIAWHIQSKRKLRWLWAQFKWFR